MENHTKKAQSVPKFGLLLMVCLVTVAFLGLLTWVMVTYFPDFPNW
ncbi:MAG TPA: hypothetical protein VFF16_06900 [Telluria sp.]|nr:hypothetical protein [Telluria sp.]